jgi:hypothetical protein
MIKSIGIMGLRYFIIEPHKRLFMADGRRW